MKIKIAAIISLISLSMAETDNDFSLPPEIAEGIVRSQYGESFLGDLSMEDVDVDEAVFESYIKLHWRDIAENIESLPASEPRLGFERASLERARRTSVIKFIWACECLPPMEYVELWEKLFSLYEEGRISLDALDSNFSGHRRKFYFFAVNWEHPRVKALFERALSIIPEDSHPPDLRNHIISISKGELADQYLVEDVEDWPLPETLPGIKLKRPFGSMIPMIERLTGKKVPPDPNFPDENTTRPAKGTPYGSPATAAEISRWGLGQWTALVASLGIFLFALFKAIAARRSTR